MSSGLKRAFNLAKYPIALTLLVLVLREADTDKMLAQLSQMPPLWVLLAFVAFGGAQLCAVWRMNAYYAHAGRPIGFGYSWRLHYVALFYNIILPGGIGGDGYKVYLLNRQADYPVKEGIRIQILTRLNGLLVLGLSLCATLPFLSVTVPYRGVLAIIIALAGVGAYWLLVSKLFKAQCAMEWRALPFSAGVQGLNVLVMLSLWHGLGGQGEDVAAVFLFQLAAVAGMIPITIGGLGIREVTFYYGAQWLEKLGDAGIDPEAAVSVSLLVFAMTVLHAMIGLLWLTRIRTLKP